MRRLLSIAGFLLVLTLGYAVVERRAVGPWLSALLTPAEEAKPKPTLDAGVSWASDWYTIQRLDPATIAIGEPRAIGRNVSYLLLGSEKALLFDAGEGWTNLKPVVDDLTALPVTVLPSHLHYDHLGSIEHFASVALPDLPHLRAQVRDGVLVPTYEQHLGVTRSVDPPQLRPSLWWAPNTSMQLGGRELVLRHTPGHTPECVSLWDPQHEWLFSGDYLSPRQLYAFLPGSSLADYRRTTRTLVKELPENVSLWGAHDEATNSLAPRLAFSDLQDLKRALEGIERGEVKASGFYPRVYPVNDQIEIWADYGDH